MPRGQEPSNKPAGQISANFTTQYRSLMENRKSIFNVPVQNITASYLIWEEFAYLANTFVGWPRVGSLWLPLSIPGNTPSLPPLPAWQQARQPRIESSASIARGNKDQRERWLGQRDLGYPQGPYHDHWGENLGRPEFPTCSTLSRLCCLSLSAHWLGANSDIFHHCQNENQDKFRILLA